ncbi:MAG: efflux RND transporter periplasmic adaptor subunit [Pseudomonadota bacterium]
MIHKLNQRYIIGGSIGLLLLLWFASGLFKGRHTEQTKAPALVRVAVRSSKAVQRVSELVLRGHTQANRSVTLRAEVPGPVASIEVMKGARVIQSQEILLIDPEERLELLKQGQALLDQRQLEFDAATKLGIKKFRSKTQLAQAEAQLREAEAELARIRTDLKNTKILAPFSGILADRYVEVGDYVIVGDKLAMVVELDPLKVVASVSEQDVGHINLETTSRIRLASGETVKGVVTFVGSVAEAGTRTFPVELAFANPGYQIRDGLTAEVYIPVKQVLAHKVSPAILSLNDAGQVGVKSVNAQSLVQFHPIKVIGHDGDGLWVTGLPESIRLVTTGHDFITHGQKVVAVPE